MEAKGKIRDVYLDKYSVVVCLEMDNGAGLDELKDKDLKVKLTKYKKKRSLDANAYHYVLCSKIAEHNGFNQTVEDVHYELMLKYGTYDDINGDYVIAYIPSNIPVEHLQGYWKKTRSVNGFTSYIAIKPSHEYNSSEMAKLINVTVREAQALGIQTLTYDELERMKGEWHGK